MAAVDPQTTQLEFYQAMADFKTMFPSMDDDVIEAVLRWNKGAVDATIDQLLAMSTDYENQRIRAEMDLKDSQQHVVNSVDTAHLLSLDEEGADKGGGGTERHPLWSRWSSSVATMASLPHDFLRLPSPPHIPQSEMELEDERIAALLQNEEFMKELRWNKDFISTLDRESPEERDACSLPLRVVDDEAAFKERLKNMGKLSKKKFSQLGRVFTGRKKRGAKSILKENATKDNLLLKEDQDSD